MEVESTEKCLGVGGRQNYLGVGARQNLVGLKFKFFDFTAQSTAVII